MASANHGPGSKNGPSATHTAPTPGTTPAISQSCGLIEKTLGSSPAFRKVDNCLYVVKQGSSYVMISVLGSGPNKDRALVRVTAQVVSGVRAEPSLFRQLLILNGTLRFGAFAYVPDGEIILFNHSLLGGATLDASEILAAVHDVALVADGYDDRIVARYGGRRMQDVIEESALSHLLNPEPDENVLLEDDEAPPEPVASIGPPARRAFPSGQKAEKAADKAAEKAHKAEVEAKAHKAETHKAEAEAHKPTRPRRSSGQASGGPAKSPKKGSPS